MGDASTSALFNLDLRRYGAEEQFKKSLVEGLLKGIVTINLCCYIHETWQSAARNEGH